MLIEDNSLLGWWLSSRARITEGLRRGFDSLTLLVTWTLWKERNLRAFGRGSRQPTFICDEVVSQGQD
jgi:hypothetical protein